MRITVDGHRREKSTGEKVHPDKWETKTNRVIGRGGNAKLINQHLQNIERKIKEARNQLELQKQPLTADALKAEFEQDTPTIPIMTMVRFKNHLDDVKKLIGKDYSKSTWIKYRTAYRHLKKMLKQTNRKSLPITKIDLQFIEDFEKYLKTNVNCNHNTTLKYIGVFKKIVLEAYRKNIINSNPFDQYKSTFKKTNPTYLEWDELLRIENKKFAIKRLELVKDRFVFTCYTGLAYSDLDELKTSNIHKDKDADLWLIKKRKKTNEPSRILLLPKAVELVHKYKGQNNPYVFPSLSNQKSNAYLKEVADLCGVDKHLSTHTGRHTFATTVTLAKGVPIKTVQQMLGHSDIRTTEHYARMTTVKVQRDMKELKLKLTNEPIA